MGDSLSSGWGIVLLIAGGVVLFNLGLIYAVLSGSAATQVQILRKVADKARSPWREEEDDLKDLRERIRRLQNSDPGTDRHD